MVTYCVITSIRVHFSLKVCFQLQFVATVHMKQMKSRHININTYVLFQITSKCVGFCWWCPHSWYYSIYFFLLSERDWFYHISYFLCHLRVARLSFLSKPMQKHTCIILLQCKSCLLSVTAGMGLQSDTDHQNYQSPPSQYKSRGGYKISVDIIQYCVVLPI